MLFSSISFLYSFLPFVLVLYFVIPPKGRNAALLIASLVFYAWGEFAHLHIVLFSILSAFVWGILLEKYRGTWKTKLFFIISVTIQVVLLVWFKFFQSVLPIGISFYTFQILSYTIDLYWDKVKVQKNPFHFAMYVLLFPQLIAGPIVRYGTVECEIRERDVNKTELSAGAVRFITGLGKKVLLANTMGELCVLYRSGVENSVLFAWLYIIGFTLQIYFDFSGYSDMAIGLGQIFGFHFPENFNLPYMAKSITEFWRRWHMTLGTWFRDYVYIPLGGNRVKKYRHIINILLVWVLTGLWHGAGWQFFTWGLYFAFWLFLEKYVLLSFYNKMPVWLRHIITISIIMFGWVLFDSGGIQDALNTLGRLFGIGTEMYAGKESVYYLKSYFISILICIVGATGYPRRFVAFLEEQEKWDNVVSVVQPFFLIVLLLLVTSFLIDGSYNPFIYFRF